MKNIRKMASMTRVLFTTHMEILLTYWRVVALLGSLGGEEKAQVMKNENNPEKIIIKSRSISLLSVCQTELSSQSDPRWCFVYNTHSQCQSLVYDPRTVSGSVKVR